MAHSHTYGINGQQAPELSDFDWIDGNGNATKAQKLADYAGKFVVLYCFQHWCPGCHSAGLPSLKQMVSELKGNSNVVFLGIQTVFEGFEENSFDKLRETQLQYQLEIPFGHDIGNVRTNNISSTMYHYRTGGTPWFVFIDKQRNVVFNDYHLNAKEAIVYLKTM